MMFVSCFRLVVLLSLVWILSGQVLAASGPSDTSLSLGYRVDSLDWNIDGGSSGPNILSELEWRDMDILQLRGGLTSANREGFYFRGYVDYGWVLDGVNQDSDYAGDNRTSEFSRSISEVDGSRVLDLSGGLGFTYFAGISDQYRIIPLVGYSYHNQDLRMRNGFQVVPAFGPFAGLDSSYESEWSGPWLGVDVLLDLQGGNRAFVRMEKHWVDYYAKANWNLRDTFAHPVSFEHEANGSGWVLELGWQNAPSPYRWVWGVTVSLQAWTTETGIDRTFLVIPGPPCNGNCYSEGLLNEVNWSSQSINFTLSKAFSD